MDSDLLKDCIQRAPRSPLTGSAWRAMGVCQPLTTNRLVDNLAEQLHLDKLLNNSIAPQGGVPLRQQSILATAWSQRAVVHGSRFRPATATGLFYGSETPQTAMAEAAYRQLRFWQAMTTPPTQRPVTSVELVSYSYHCQTGVRLQHRTFKPLTSVLNNPQTTPLTQSIAGELAQRSIEGFEYPSVRCPDFGLNIALLTPDVLTTSAPTQHQSWLLARTEQGIECSGAGQYLTFNTQQLLCGNQ